MNQYLSILVSISLLNYHNLEYWTQSKQVSSISNIMSINRFEKIRQYFHCNVNSKNVQSSDPNYDKLYKVRPVVDLVLKKCRQIPREEVHCIDEQIIPTKGRSSIKQYLPNKPNKWGIKVWARCVLVEECTTLKSTQEKTAQKRIMKLRVFWWGEMLCTVSHKHCHSIKMIRYSLTISFHQLLCSSY